jgi:hypothetical protein
MKTYWGVEVKLHTFFDPPPPALDGGEWSSSCPDRFTPQGKTHWYPLDRSMVGPQSQFEYGVEEKIPSPRWELNPNYSTSSQLNIKTIMM